MVPQPPGGTYLTGAQVPAVRRAAAQRRLTALQEPLSDEREQKVGQGMAYLLLRPEEWVHRRVELLSFLDQENVRRQMSVDCTPPRHRRSVGQMFSVVGEVLPLSMLEKHTLQHFSIWDEERRPLPVLTTTQNGRLSAACLVSMATEVNGGTTLPADVAEAFRLVVNLPTRQALFLLRRMRDPDGAEALVDRLAALMDAYFNFFRPHPGLIDIAAASTSHASLLKSLLGNAVLNGLTEELATQFVMCVPLEGGRRRVVKFDYEEPIRTSTGSMPRRLAESGVESVGWKAKSYTFDGVAPGEAESHHVEVVAPEQLEFCAARFTASNGDTGEVLKHDELSVDELGADRVHLQVRGAPRSAIGVAQISLRAVRLGVLLPATAVGLITALILLAASSRASLVSEEAGAALLLLGPTLLAALVARPGEHPLTTRLLLGIRTLVVGSGMASFVAAGALAAQYGDGKLEDVWFWATLAAILFAGMLLFSFLWRPGGWPARKAGAFLQRSLRSVRTLSNYWRAGRLSD